MPAFKTWRSHSAGSRAGCVCWQSSRCPATRPIFELERRQVSDWPTLTPDSLLVPEKTGPPRPDTRNEKRGIPHTEGVKFFAPTAKSRAAFLRRWGMTIGHPARQIRVVTWFALSPPMPPALFRRQLQRREKFLKQQLGSRRIKVAGNPARK